MRPVSDRWAAAVAASYRMVTRVTFTAPSGKIIELPVINGTVTLDASATVRGTTDLQLAGKELTGLVTSGELAPLGGEVNVTRGIIYPDGTEELVSLGHFGVEDVTVSDSGGNNFSVRLSGLDRSRRIQYATFEEAWASEVTWSIPTIIVAAVWGAGMLPEVSPGFLDLNPLPLPKPLVVSEGDDRLELCQGLASAIGCGVYFDGDGVYTLRRNVLVGSPVASVTDGENGVLLSVERDWSRSEAFNRVIATGESTVSDDDHVWRGVATDDDASSPTYYHGPFGRVPIFWSNPYVASDASAKDAAQSKLNQERGIASGISFGMVPNPALEPGDVIYVEREELGVAEHHVLDSVVIGLGPGDLMRATTRQIQVFS